MSEIDIVRWDVEPLERSRRGVDDWLTLAAPWLGRRLARRAMQEPAGSRLRRAVLTRAIRSAVAANNREDHEVLLANLHPDLEMSPPERGESALGFDPVYRGHEGYKRFLADWKSGFGRHRYEPREIADPGGNQFAFRFALFGTFAHGESEIAGELWSVNTLHDGLVVRQEHYRGWDEALEALNAGARPGVS